ncbi:hypothetical protein ACS0TY_035995 [Phlomoides rotata]
MDALKAEASHQIGWPRSVLVAELQMLESAIRKRGVMNPRWGYFRIITGTLLGGVLGFYCMHRAELKYKEMWERRLKKYEEEMNARKNEEAKPNEELL